MRIRNRTDLLENNRLRYEKGTLFRVYTIYLDGSVWAEPVANKGLKLDGTFDPLCFMPDDKNMEIVLDRSAVRG